MSDFPDIALTGYYFQLTLGKKLSDEPHNHDFYELLCVLYGSCEHEINKTASPMSAGDTAFLRPGDAHRFTRQSPGTNVLALSIAPMEVRNFIIAYGDPFRTGSASLTLRAGTLSELCALGSESLVRNPRERVPLCRLMLGLIVGQANISADASASGTAAVPKDFRAVLSEMNKLENAREGVPAFLRLSNFSHAQLCRLTAKYLGMTPNEYVTDIRMRCARELVESGADFSDAADAVGYSSLSHFSALFRTTWGMTLSAARRSAREAPRTV